MSQEIALRELNRCLPKSVNLSIYDSVDDIWRELGRLYGNPLTISSSIMDKFLDLKPHNINGETKDIQLANLKKARSPRRSRRMAQSPSPPMAPSPRSSPKCLSNRK